MKLPMRLALLSLVLCASAAQAQRTIDVTKHDMRPLIQLHAVGANIIGETFEADVFIYRGGPTFLAFSLANGRNTEVKRGVAKPQQLIALNQALAAARVGQQREKCGGPAPDYITDYALTWYGTKGLWRTHSAGGNYSECPADVIRIFNATCTFIWEVLGPSIEICDLPGPTP